MPLSVPKCKLPPPAKKKQTFALKIASFTFKVKLNSSCYMLGEIKTTNEFLYNTRVKF